MSHVFCHDKAGNGAGRPQHDNDGNQLVLCKIATDGKRKKKCFITDKFHKCTGNRCFQPGKGFSEVQRSAHSHEAKRSGGFCKIACRRVQDLRKWKTKKGPECTGCNAENDGIGDNSL